MVVRGVLNFVREFFRKKDFAAHGGQKQATGAAPWHLLAHSAADAPGHGTASGHHACWHTRCGSKAHGVCHCPGTLCSSWRHHACTMAHTLCATAQAPCAAAMAQHQATMKAHRGTTMGAAGGGRGGGRLTMWRRRQQVAAVVVVVAVVVEGWPCGRGWLSWWVW